MSTPTKITREPVRIASDLMEMMRTICYHTRTVSGRRPKVSRLLDDYLRPKIEREYAKVSGIEN